MLGVFKAKAGADLILELGDRSFTILGIILILMGIILVALHLINRYIPNLEKLPWILIWVYRSDGFVFVTSPILIIVTIVSLLIQLLSR